MYILKFGGSSLANANKIKTVYSIVSNINTKKVIVLSAIGKSTDLLVGLTQAFNSNSKELFKNNFELILQNHLEVIDQLFSKDYFKAKAKTALYYHLDYINLIVRTKDSVEAYNETLVRGEYISTEIFYWYTQEQNADSAFLRAEKFMRIDENKEPDFPFIEKNLKEQLSFEKNSSLYITQGFLCKNHLGYIDNLERGGSDYTATIIGNAIHAEQIQIWSDINGVHDNDPRYVSNTSSIPFLSFEEANELAYFGAKVLHPICILPAQSKNIPVILKNTNSPEEAGTVISHKTVKHNIKAIAAKDNITSIKIKSGRMLNAYGFLKNIFEIFENYKTSVDMVTTSEVAVSVTIDDTSYLNQIIQELEKFANVEIDYNQSIICVVGNFISDKAGVIPKITNALKNIPIRMISYGGSKHNISILVHQNDKIEALNMLHSKINNRLSSVKIENAYAN